MKIIYQKAEQKDFEEVLKLSFMLHKIKDDAEKEKITNWEKESLRKDTTWVAIDNNQIIGYISCLLFNDAHRFFPNSVFVNNLYVLENYRKRGIGSRLMRLVLDEKYPENYKYFSVTHSPKETELTGFYKKFGFKENGITEVGNIKMIREIL